MSVRIGLSEGDEVFAKEHSEDGWLALERCLGVTDDEWWFYYEVEDENTKKGGWLK